MNVKKRKIGRGLSSLLGDITFSEIEGQASSTPQASNQYNSASAIFDVPIEDIMGNPHQPRKYFNEESIIELAESIKASGVLQPIIVQKNGNKFNIIVGERRYRASKMAGIKTIPCVVRNFTEEQTLVVAMIENIQRSNLNPLEEAFGYKTICEKHGISHAEIAKMLGKSRSHITNMIGVLSMPSDIQEMLSNGELSIGHAKVLKKLSNAKETSIVAQKIKKESMSVRALEQHIDTLITTHKQQKEINHNNIESLQNNVHHINVSHTPQEQTFSLDSIPSEILAIEDAFNAKFSPIIHIEHKGNSEGGKISINYTDIEELRFIMSHMVSLEDIYAK
ncbi:MAG: ParB family chromosome partitioning protein [Candidatus Deianiraeaceae bacterium]|jgi:ParB family chromosome partitioning protein